jgi:hypothetical protein
MKRMLNIALLLTSLTGYLEWGKGMHSFLFQVEYDLLFGAAGNSDSFAHPFVLLPLIGQLMLLASVFQKTPGRFLTYAGLACLSLIMVFIFLIGIMGMNWKIALSAVPFIIVGILVLRRTRRGSKGYAVAVGER